MMGVGSSVSSRAKHGPSSAAIKRQLTSTREMVLEKEKQFDHHQNQFEETTTAKIKMLQAQNEELTEKLTTAERELSIKKESLEKEKNRALALMFSELPLSMLSGHSSTLSGDNTSFSKQISSVTIACCDVVGFSSVVSNLPPHQVINLVDHIHAIIDDAFSDKRIFVMERSSDSCLAVCGITKPEDELEDVQSQQISTRNDINTPVSMADSCYETGDEAVGSHENLYRHTKPHSSDLQRSLLASKKLTNTAHNAALVAVGALQLMSMSTQVKIPDNPDFHLQMRIALHSGDCLGGIVGLQTVEGSRQVPKYKLFGPTVKEAQNLCASGLALQIRVSKSCRNLLQHHGGFNFERCPDRVSWHGKTLTESYWLLSKDGLPLKMPSLDDAVSLSAYDDI